MYRHPTSDKQIQSPIHQPIWVRSEGVKWIMEEPMANPWWHAGTKRWPLTEAIYCRGPDWWFAESRCHISHPQQWSVLSHNESGGPLPDTEDLPGWFIFAELGTIVNKVCVTPRYYWIALWCIQSLYPVQIRARKIVTGHLFCFLIKIFWEVTIKYLNVVEYPLQKLLTQALSLHSSFHKH